MRPDWCQNVAITHLKASFETKKGKVQHSDTQDTSIPKSQTRQADGFAARLGKKFTNYRALSLCLSVSPSVSRALSLSLYLCLAVCPSVRPSVCLPDCLSGCLHVGMCMCRIWYKCNCMYVCMHVCVVCICGRVRALKHT